MKVDIFKTNVQDKNLAKLLILNLQKIISDCLINFDLEDKDNILRVSGNRDVSGLVIQLLTEYGVVCKHLGAAQKN